MDFVTKFTKSISQGYIVEVQPEFYTFILTVEQTARKVLNVNFIKNYKGKDLRECIEEKLKDDLHVSNSWLTLTRHCPNEKLIIHLQKEVLSKWIDIRANSFVNSYVLVLKRKLKENKMSSASEPSIRKTLH